MADVRRSIAAPPEKVFAVIAQGWLYPTWVVGAARMRDVTPDWPAPGSKLHHSFGLWPALLNDETEVLLCDPPNRLMLKARGWPAGEAQVEVTIGAGPNGGSLVTLAEDVSDGPARYLPTRMRVAAIAARNRESLRRLAFIAEGIAPDLLPDL